MLDETNCLGSNPIESLLKECWIEERLEEIKDVITCCVLQDGTGQALAHVGGPLTGNHIRDV
jgi:hypothetical protein